MERDGNHCVAGDKSHPDSLIDGDEFILSSTFFLDHVGEVTLTFNPEGLSWELVEPLVNVSADRLLLK